MHFRANTLAPLLSLLIFLSGPAVSRAALPDNDETGFTPDLPLDLHLYSFDHLYDPLEVSPKYEPPMITDFGDWLIDNRADWSKQVQSLGVRMDSFFWTKESLDRSNASYLKVGLESRYGKFGEFKFEPIMRFKLDLPTLEEHLRLVIDSDPDDLRSLAERTRTHSLLESERTPVTTTGQFQFLKEEFQQWETTSSIGIKLRNPIDPFWKIRSYRAWELEDDWSMIIRQNLYFYHVEGWGESTQVQFERPLSDSLSFRSYTELEWVHQARRMELAQLWGIRQELSPKRAIKYQLGVLGQNRPGPEISGYYVNTLYKRLLYKSWLYYEIVPELFFPRDDDFKPNPSLTLRIEMLLSTER